MSEWKDVERELGAHGPADALAKIGQMWTVIIAARYLVMWWDHPDIHRGLPNPFIDERERAIRSALEALDGPRSSANESEGT